MTFILLGLRFDLHLLCFDGLDLLDDGLKRKLGFFVFASEVVEGLCYTPAFKNQASRGVNKTED